MKKRLLFMLAGACAVMALSGCGKKAADEPLESATEESSDDKVQESEENANKEETIEEEPIEGIVKLTVGENEYTDAVYEFAAATEEMQEGEFAYYLVDFDGNGMNEAFVLRGYLDETDDSRWFSKNVWFVNEELKVDQIFGWYSPNVTYYLEEEFKNVGGEKCFFLDGYDVFDETPFCYMYRVKDGALVDVTADFAAEKEPFESKYTEEELGKMTPQQLFDAFCKGEIQAEFKDIDGNTGYFDTREWGWSLDDMNDYQKVLDPYDVDNDGEPEYIIDTIYGIMCFDCKDGKVVDFAEGTDTTTVCRYITYDNATWIVFQDTLHEGRCTYQLYKFNGDLEITDSMNLYWYEDDAGNRTYFYNDEEIAEDKYNEISKKIFGE